MKKLLSTMACVAAVGFFPTQQASAHISWINLTNLTPVIDGDKHIYSANSIVSGNYGWADAMDEDWGDSHQGAWIQFTLTESSNVKIHVESDYQDTFLNFNGNLFPLKIGDLTPGFSLYSGVLPDEAHDYSVPPPAGKEGAWNGQGTTTMGNDDGEVGTIYYIGHAGEIDGLATAVSWMGTLEAGIYTVAIGGTCYERENCGAFNRFNADNAMRGFDINLTVAPVPLPAAIWLMGAGLFGLGAFRKRSLAV
ncbi:MAG TPA: hypothetical protein DCZ48_09940 [Methylococcaceae bacterium]|nr:hypothetical protein [Methylococcaceae bacterium]